MCYLGDVGGFISTLKVVASHGGFYCCKTDRSQYLLYMIVQAPSTWLSISIYQLCPGKWDSARFLAASGDAAFIICSFCFTWGFPSVGYFLYLAFYFAQGEGGAGCLLHLTPPPPPPPFYDLHVSLKILTFYRGRAVRSLSGIVCRECGWVGGRMETFFAWDMWTISFSRDERKMSSIGTNGIFFSFALAIDARFVLLLSCCGFA